jgi:hypothetical protein
MRLALSSTLAAILLLPALASAQSLDGLTTNLQPFSVSLTPQYPAAFAPVSLSFLSSTLDLNNATLAVSVGGKQIYQGSVQPVTVMVGKAGSVTSVTVTVTSAGAHYSQTLTLQPQDVALIAEPLSSSPVLYPGKSLVPLEGDTRIVAIANIADAKGASIDPSTLSYTWTVDGAQIANSSGIGKAALVVASPIQYRSRDVSVLVQSQAGSLVGQASLSLSPEEPSVRIYENDPLLGIRYAHALGGSYTIRSTEASLFAAPFSLPISSGAPLVQWFLNGDKAQTGNVITLRPTGSGQGTAALSLTASGAGTSLATAGATLSLIFGAAPSTSFFGL